MAFIVISPGDIDAESPISDNLFSEIKIDLDWINSAISDGATASQNITAKKIIVKDTGVSLTVDYNGQITGNLNVGGTLTVGSFVNPETALIFLGR